MKLPELEPLITCYDEARFLDAYKATEHLWEHLEIVESFTPEQLIFAGRLANRLGGHTLSRRLYRAARKRFPNEPLIRYYARSSGPHSGLLDELRDLLESPELGSGDARYDVSWHARNAMIWASVRDFDRAHQELKKAESFKLEWSWVHYCRAQVLMVEDRLQDALTFIEKAWELAATTPNVASLNGYILSKLGRLDEAADRLDKIADTAQSFEVVQTAMWYVTAQAERSTDETCRTLAQRAYDLGARAKICMPLADRRTKATLAWYQLDAAFLLERNDLVKKHAEEARSPFFKSVAKNIERNPDGKTVLLAHKPVYQFHMTCLPASVATILSDVAQADHEDLTRAYTFGGTADWRIGNWANEKGLVVRYFILTEELARKLIDLGLPFIMCTQGPDSSHATAVVGLDYASETLIIHDPGGVRWSRMLLSGIGVDEKPLGQQAMVFVPREKEALLDVIPAEAWEPQTATVKYYQDLEQRGPGEAAKGVGDVVARWSEHPVALRLQALCDSRTGRPGVAVEQQEKLLSKYPECIFLQRDLLDTSYRLRNTAKVLKVLEDAVTRGLLPGVKADQAWREPPAVYMARYADQLREASEKVDEAHTWLRKAHTQNPYSAEVYHDLADLLWQQGRFQEMLLPYRLAAQLDDSFDHYSVAYADGLRKTGQETEALAFLKKRVETLGNTVGGAGPWRGWIESLYSYGRPEKAAAAMKQSEEQRPKDLELASFASRFWLRYGEWDRARLALDRTASEGQTVHHLRAAAHYHTRRGDLEAGIKATEAWIESAVDDMEARDRLLDLISRRDGTEAALEQARAWSEARSEDESFEELYLEYLDHLHLHDEREVILRRRLARNSQDGWGWCELGHQLLRKLELAESGERSKIEKEVREVLEHAERTANRRIGIFTLKSRLAYIGGKSHEAVEHLLDALQLNQDNSYFYRRAWSCSGEWPVDEQKELLKKLEFHLLRCVGHLSPARDLVSRVASRFGFQEALDGIARWKEASPDDPELAEAEVDLLLDQGQGVSDTKKAIVLLEAFLKKFPHHIGLRFSLAQAHHALQEYEEEAAVHRELLRWSPRYAQSRINLAYTLARLKRMEEAYAVLDEGHEIDPTHKDIWWVHANLLWDEQRFDEALEILHKALKRAPEAISLLENLIERLLKMDRHQEAIDLARRAVEAKPEGAYLWFVLGQTLASSHRASEVAEIENAYRTALKFNASLFEAAEQLSLIFADQKRFEDARTLLNQQLDLQPEGSRIRGRLAWMLREEGKKSEARKEMIKVLKLHPNYQWGWYRLMEWFEADEAWKQARSALETVSRGLLEDPDFAADRLALLRKAGVAKKELDPQWDLIIENFPTNENIHLTRFDELFEAKRFKEAESLLDSITKHEANSPYILGRRVMLLSRKDDSKAAIDVALQIIRMPGDDQFWPELESMRRIHEAGWAQELIQAIVEELQRGERIRLPAFRQAMTMFRETHEDEWRKSIPFLPGRWKYKAERDLLERMLNALEKASWPTSEFRAGLLDEYSEIDSAKEILKYFETHQDECRTDPNLYKIIGRAYYKSGFYEKCNTWFTDWRDHSEIEMWAVSIYLLTLFGETGTSGKNKLDADELYRSANAALNTLAHDHTARFVAISVCEGALRNGDDATFLKSMKQFESVLADEEAWLPDIRAWAPEVFKLFTQLMESPDRATAIRLTKSLRKTCKDEQPSEWAKQDWFERIRPIVPFYRRWWEYLRIWLALY